MATLDDFVSFLQGASNSAASNLSAPVDGINWLLGKAGLPVSKAPVGGSDWLRQAGFTAEPKNRNAGLLGEAVGNIIPIVAAAKAPQIAAGLNQAGRNLAAPRTLNPQTGAIVWHGSPHKFDKFDSSKIGTGEGAQAYGHGLYLAESDEVAKSYQKTLSDDGFLVGDKVFNPSSLQHMNVRSVARRGDLDAAIAKAQEMASSGSPVSGMAAQDLARLREIQAAGGMQKNTGALYKVDLPDEQIAKMLDWDKPLSQQHPDVQAVFNLYKYAPDSPIHGMTGMEAYVNYGKRFGNPTSSTPETAKAFRELGIPGIRYLDGGSRGAGGGTSNFVVFPGNEGLLSILERNGQPLR